MGFQLMKRKSIYKCCLLFIVLFNVSSHAGLPEEIISPLNAKGITNAKISAGDFKFHWIAEALPQAKLSIDLGSVEWVRVRETLILPRARALVELESEGDAELIGPGFVVPLIGQSKTHFPIPLIAAKNLIYTIKKNINGQIRFYSFELVYQSSDSNNKEQVFFDTSCSKYDLDVKNLNLKNDSWIFVGCLIDPMESSDGPAVNLEIQIFWQRPQSEYSLNGIVEKEKSVLEPIVVRAAPPSVFRKEGEFLLLESGESKVSLNYKLPWKIYRGRFALGLGPYLFNFQQGTHKIDRTVLMPTVYGAFNPTPSTRLVFFNATTISKPWTADSGLYFSYESVKFLDRRVSLQILLGGHSIAFDSHKGYVMQWGAPQGAELIGTDIFIRGYNMAVGGFVFPWIGGKAYNNIWLRYGTKRLFIEFNYIMWREKIEDVSYYSQSTGLTLGTPLDFLSF